ncbi:GNAT family N-acetyltransferase [Alicyclobacillus sp. ALC3]|uniref:GNAT family N-acetyltransferase n=1 Tax=Alicyclobacillus sp. ALC3 TaxID=2796143 RepID=UPI00237963A1|nr:GNAT family N-acetyltransferase [Alicyclobacillus sp. ALC3]WDL97270.1 GNAT family N-acetyltransferase [Alicyclobacillus sp. ALC3]
MLTVQKAELKHVEGICGVCTRGYWATYASAPKAYIQRIVDEFYNVERVSREVHNGEYWVALDGELVVGAGGGGMISEREGELYVLYVEPTRKYQGIGTLLLHAVTQELKELGAEMQWVSVAKGNQMAIPFYESHGFQFQQERKAYASLEDEDHVSLRYKRSI